MTDTPRLSMPEIASGQSDKTTTHNDALRFLDILVQTAVEDKDLSTPPGSPATGALYIVKATGTGAWAGQDKALAYYRAGWYFIAPWEGLTVWVKDEDKPYTYSGTAWVLTSSAGMSLDDLADVTITSAATGDMLRWSGSAWVNEKPIYDVGINRTTGTPTASQVLLDFVFPRTCVLPVDMTGSVAEASVAATAQTDFDVRKNGSSVATIRFAASGTSASFINAGADTFSAGDNLTVVAPASPDATLAGIVMTLAFTRS